jgi:chromate transporter
MVLTHPLTAVRPAPTPLMIFLAFSKVGLTSFGGGLSGWMLREFVQRRRWIAEDEFLAGLSLAQAFPGVNVVNISIWMGYRLRGGPGALAGALGIVAPAAIVVVLVARGFALLAQSRGLHAALAGVAAAAVGLSLSLGLRMAWRASAGAVPTLIMLAAFVSVGLLRVPLLPVMAVLGPLSVAWAWRRDA